VNSADDPQHCSFTLMSLVRQGDLVVTVGTGGRSPALATYLRDHVRSEMGPEYSVLLDLLSEAREAMRAGGRSSEDADWQAALDSGMLDLIRRGRVAEAKELLQTCLSSSSD
jgi:siroheme synthase-like protein